jgi:hypothetical protein
METINEARKQVDETSSEMGKSKKVLAQLDTKVTQLLGDIQKEHQQKKVILMRWKTMIICLS